MRTKGPSVGEGDRRSGKPRQTRVHSPPLILNREPAHLEIVCTWHVWSVEIKNVVPTPQPHPTSLYVHEPYAHVHTLTFRIDAITAKSTRRQAPHLSSRQEEEVLGRQNRMLPTVYEEVWQSRSEEVPNKVYEGHGDHQEGHSSCEAYRREEGTQKEEPSRSTRKTWTWWWRRRWRRGWR